MRHEIQPKMLLRVAQKAAQTFNQVALSLVLLMAMHYFPAWEIYVILA